MSDPLHKDDIKLPLMARLMRACLLEIIAKLSCPMTPWIMNVEPNSVTNEKNKLEDDNFLCHFSCVFVVPRHRNKKHNCNILEGRRIAKKFGCMFKGDNWVNANSNSESDDDSKQNNALSGADYLFGTAQFLRSVEPDFHGLFSILLCMMDAFRKKRGTYPANGESKQVVLDCCQAAGWIGILVHDPILHVGWQGQGQCVISQTHVLS